MKIIEQKLCWGGEQRRYEHQSEVLQCPMTFSLFVPPHVSARTPVLFWLSGLTCTDENFVIKAGAQRWAAEYDVAVLCPDTSPRGIDVPDDERYSLGQGASFYINARFDPWRQNYQMEDYICLELPRILDKLDIGRCYGILGHSMGGHGALTLGLRHADLFHSISAIAPIGSLPASQWGRQALQTYLGEDRGSWSDYDAAHLLAHISYGKVLRVDVGLADEYWDELGIVALVEAARHNHVNLDLHMHGGYDHSYFFINSVIREHILMHKHQLEDL